MLLLTSLHGGGAERAAVHILNTIDRSRFDARIGLLQASGPWLAEADPDRVIVAPGGDRFTFEGSNRSFYRPDRLLAAVNAAPRGFRHLIREDAPDVVMSFMKGTSLAVWRALTGLGRARPRFIVREGNNTLAVIDEEVSNRAARRIVAGLTARAYRAADCVLANSHDMAEGIAADLGLDPARMRVINNPIDVDGIERMAVAPPPDRPRRPFILTVGRLEYQKAHDVLLRAYAACEARNSHDLVILGRGSRLAELNRLAVELGIEGKVRFEGFAANPYSWMAASDLFVLPSRWEGFPTVAAEALAAGAPVLISDCRFGPTDVLVPGESGWMVPVDDPPALAAAIDRLIADPALRARLAAAGRARVQLFRLDRIVRDYENLFAEQAARA